MIEPGKLESRAGKRLLRFKHRKRKMWTASGNFPTGNILPGLSIGVRQLFHRQYSSRLSHWRPASDVRRRSSILIAGLWLFLNPKNFAAFLPCLDPFLSLTLLVLFQVGGHRRRYYVGHHNSIRLQELTGLVPRILVWHFCCWPNHTFAPCLHRYTILTHTFSVRQKWIIVQYVQYDT